MNTSRHVVEAVRNVRTRVGSTHSTVTFMAHCSCGESAGPFSAAGMVWGWEARHREESENHAGGD